MEHDFSWWRNALAGRSALSTKMIRSRAITACATARAAPSSPWRSGTTGRGSTRCAADGRSIPVLWTWCCREPIAYETYVAVAERGEPWPDAVPAIGHNSAGLA